jgi:methionyl-tRNA formyltransferase
VALRVIFCGTPAFALPTLRLLLKESDFAVQAVFTQPDRPRGRGHQPARSPTKEAALQAGIPVHQPEKMRSESVTELISEIRPDAAVIIAFGQIIPRALLEIPRLGWVNLHGSLLPKYRGAAPVQRAILAGDEHTGLTTMRLDAGLDTGPIVEQLRVSIGRDETAAELLERMSEMGAPLMLDTLRKLDRGEIAPRAQENALATLAPPLKKEEGLIDWRRSASATYNRIRAFDPWPGTYTHFREKLCHIWGRPAGADFSAARTECGTIVRNGENIFVACGQTTWLQLEAVRLEGRKRVTGTEFANGARLTNNERFT